MPALGIGFWVDAVAVCLAQGGELADLRTGVADDGSLIAIGNDDDDWILSNGPASVGPYPRPATVTNTDGAWQVIAGTRWISLNASHTGPNGTYIYERTFEVPSATIDLQITGTARSDNQASVLVNGAKVASLASGSFTGAETSISTAWMTCGGATSQTIRVDVVEGGFGTGLDVGASVNGTPRRSRVYDRGRPWKRSDALRARDEHPIVVGLARIE